MRILVKQGPIDTRLGYCLRKFGVVIPAGDGQMVYLPSAIKKLGSGALSGKILLVRIVENNKIDTYKGRLG